MTHEVVRGPPGQLVPERTELCSGVLQAACAGHHDDPRSRVLGCECGGLPCGLDRSMKVIVELAHVRCGNIAAEPAAADGPSGEKQHISLESGGVAAVRSVLAPLGEPVAVLGGDLAEQLDAVPSFVPVLARVVEVGGRWPPVALRGRVCERHEFQLGALRERRAGTAGVQFVTGGQAVPGRVEAPRGESRPCSCQRLPENQAREQDKHCDVEEELHHGTRS